MIIKISAKMRETAVAVLVILEGLELEDWLAAAMAT